MKKKIVRVMIMALFIFVLTFTVIGIKAATCSGGGQTCEGPCCCATSQGCIAGPCNIIFPEN